jgi:hypothetical protein
LQGKDSFWKPWLDVLPKDFLTLPMFFTQEEQQQLTGSEELIVKVSADVCLGSAH